MVYVFFRVRGRNLYKLRLLIMDALQVIPSAPVGHQLTTIFDHDAFKNINVDESTARAVLRSHLGHLDSLVNFYRSVNVIIDDGSSEAPSSHGDSQYTPSIANDSEIQSLEYVSVHPTADGSNPPSVRYGALSEGTPEPEDDIRERMTRSPSDGTMISFPSPQQDGGGCPLDLDSPHPPPTDRSQLSSVPHIRTPQLSPCRNSPPLDIRQVRITSLPQGESRCHRCRRERVRDRRQRETISRRVRKTWMVYFDADRRRHLQRSGFQYIRNVAFSLF